MFIQDRDDLPDSPSHVRVKRVRPKKLTKRRSTKRKNEHSTPLLSDDFFPPPPPELCPPKPNSNFLTPISGKKPQYLTPKVIKPMSKGSKSSEYLAGIDKSQDRATVKSWLNLGPAPCPENDISNPNRSPSMQSNNSNSHESLSHYCDVNEVNPKPEVNPKLLQREASLDEKYTTFSEPLDGDAHSRMSYNDLPKDHSGYLHLNFPGSVQKRIDPKIAQVAAKNVVKSPLPKKRSK